LSDQGALAGLLRGNQTITLGALLLITALAWAWLLYVPAHMDMAPMAEMDMSGMDMSGMDMSAMAAMSPTPMPWTLTHGLFMFAMWAVMMVGMMMPSVTPMVLIYQRVASQAGAAGQSFAPAGWFLGGYLVAWVLFAALATLAQWGLESLALLTPMMKSASGGFGAAVLVVAGIYQWLPVKDACLARCRAPLQFVQQHGGFQPGVHGSLRLGFLHGLYCIGCCWALMALLFVGGVMNLIWIAALMVLVLLEKVVPGARWLSRAAGVAFVVAGLWLAWNGVSV
jgi:predicted metal-binding membrane protein